MKHSLNILLLSLFITLSLHAEEMLSRTRMLMGTYATVTLPAQHNRQISESFSLIAKIEHALSTFDENATLARLNDEHTVPYDPVLAEAFTLSYSYYEETDGYFDVTIGSITKDLYRFGTERPQSPSKMALEHAKRNIDGFHIGKKRITSDEGIVIDLGGMGKGYAVDKTAQWLNEQNITQSIVGLSGDIRCLHTCELYLQSPFQEGMFAKITAKIPNLSISTSGTYHRYATRPEEHHLIDPKTATQGKAFVSVTLFTKADNARIDAYATAVSVMPKKKALAFLKEHKEIGYVLVEPDGNIIKGNLEPLVVHILQSLSHIDIITNSMFKKTFLPYRFQSASSSTV